MTETRLVAMTAEQYEDVEAYIETLMRAGDNEAAARMMTLALSYRFGKPREPVLPDNVVQFPAVHSVRA